MTMDRDVMLAVLSLDAYNRSYGERVSGLL